MGNYLKATARTCPGSSDDRPESEKVVARTEQQPAGESAIPQCELLVNGEWSHVALGIMVAGAAYPFMLAVLWALVGFAVTFPPLLFDGALNLSSLTQILAALLVLAIFALLFSAIGFIWSGVIAIVLLSIAYLFVWSLNLRGRMVWLGAVAGGLVGFLAVLPFLMSGGLYFGQSHMGNWFLIAVLAIGPGLATIVGQAGGAWGGKFADSLSEADYRRAIRKAMCIRPSDGDETPTENQLDQPAPIWRRFQFGIRHLLWIAVWLSLLLSVIRLTGVPFNFILPVLLTWLVYQAATLWAGFLLARRLAPRWQARRQRRST